MCHRSVYTNLFKVHCETISTTCINHSRRLIPDGIHRHEGMREEKQVFPLFNAERQASEVLVPFFYVG